MHSVPWGASSKIRVVFPSHECEISTLRANLLTCSSRCVTAHVATFRFALVIVFKRHGESTQVLFERIADTLCYAA